MTPEALRLARELEQAYADDAYFQQHAAELRRLHALNAELLKALEWIDRRCSKDYFTDKHPLHQIHWEMAHDAGACARAAIARTTGEQ